ncbi:MAG: hypothetical protein MOB07_24270 [Acidobacteria bacterium]|nr:hypothetical protein [Acidobacteriota bacterium]
MNDAVKRLIQRLNEGWYSPKTLWNQMVRNMSPAHISMIDQMLLIGRTPEWILEDAFKELPAEVVRAYVAALRYRKKQLGTPVKGQG